MNKEKNGGIEEIEEQEIDEEIPKIIESLTMYHVLAHNYDVDATLLIHPELEVALFLEHTYIKHAEENPREVELRNDLKVLVRYNNENKLLEDSVSLTMHIIMPSKLGQAFLYGVDVSPGAKTFVEFIYNKGEDDSYRLGEVVVGTKRIDVSRPQESALVSSINFPFPVPDRIECIDGWYYQIPFFPDDSGNIGQLKFPKHAKDILTAILS